MQARTQKRWVFAFGAAALTLLLTVIALNFSASEKKIDRALVTEFGVRDRDFLQNMGALLGPPILGGNTAKSLQNGAEIFPAMLGAIKGAKVSINFETYIYWSGNIGQRFAEALAERARAGVKVNVLLDWVGSQKMDDAYLTLMQDAGVRVAKYHPLRWYNVARMNNRTHRKLLIIDGLIGFTGGVGIADEWDGYAQDEKHWRDSHYRLQGPAVAHMQAAFVDNWIKATGEVLQGPSYFPAIAAAGTQRAQMFRSSPTEGSESVRLMYLLSIAAARRTVRIATAYFVPDDLSLQTLVAALKRGVKVQILLPGEKNDAWITRSASRARWGELLAAGAEIYEFQPTFFHCKVMVVDDVWVSVGSTNFDNRSFRLNDEANLNIYDDAFAGEQVAVFMRDLKRAKRVDAREWGQRPWTERVLEAPAVLLRSQL